MNSKMISLKEFINWFRGVKNSVIDLGSSAVESMSSKNKDSIVDESFTTDFTGYKNEDSIVNEPIKSFKKDNKKDKDKKEFSKEYLQEEHILSKNIENSKNKKNSRNIE